MSKEECVTKLSNLGYKVDLESGVVMITIADEKLLKTVKNTLTEIGYSASWGVRIGKENENGH